MWQEHYKLLWTQYLAIIDLSIFIIIDAVVHIFTVKDHESDDFYHASAYFVQTSAVMIYVIAR